MTRGDVLRELERVGTEQNRKIYSRHGVRSTAFGVSFANLYRIQKSVACDHELAQSLWGTGIFEARLLATMIADPSKATSTQLESWAKELDNYVVTDSFSTYVAKTSFAEKKIGPWTRSKHEWISSAGWNLVASAAMREDDTPDRKFDDHLAAIEAKIQAAPNRTRYAMNNALIAIGIRNDTLHASAVAAAKRIGKVQVDHGETSCKTPDAIPYMEKARKHRAAKAAKAAAKKRAR